MMELKQWVVPLEKTLESVGLFLPKLILCLGILLIGWVLARILESWGTRVIVGLDRMTRAQVFSREYQGIGLDQTAPKVVGRIIYWITLLFFIAAATETLGLSILSTLLTGMTQYLPNVLAAALIGFTGYLASGLARKTVSSAAVAAGISNSELLGRSSQVAILLVVVLICMEQIGIEIEFLMMLITMVLGTTLGGMALAFGLGAKTMVKNMIASHYISQTYRVGHTIRIENVQGRIIEVTPSAVVIETAEGNILFPAQEFSEKHSVLVTAGG